MFKKALALLLIFSLALNFAFAGVWAYHQFYVRSYYENSGGAESGESDDSDGPPSSLLAPGRDGFRESMHELRLSLRDQQEKLFDLLADEQTDREAIESCMEKISALRDQMEKLVVGHVLSLKKTLDPEERRKLMEFLRRRALGPSGRRFRHGRPDRFRGRDMDRDEGRPGWDDRDRERDHGPGPGPGHGMRDHGPSAACGEPRAGASAGGFAQRALFLVREVEKCTQSLW